MHVTIYTDGGCSPNPGTGGWGAILLATYKGVQIQREIYGGQLNTTNNMMELTAVIEGLKALKYPCEVTVVTDSKYLQNGIQQWITKWKANNWQTSAKAPVKNKELWIALDNLRNAHINVQFKWAKGHSDNKLNNRADELATMGRLSVSE